MWMVVIGMFEHEKVDGTIYSKDSVVAPQNWRNTWMCHILSGYNTFLVWLQ